MMARRVATSVAMGMLGLLSCSCSGPEPVAGLTYRLGPEANQVTLPPVTSPSAGVRAELADEDSQSVAVPVYVDEPAGGQDGGGDSVSNDLGREFPVTLTLSAPLAGRAVMNERQDVPEAATLRP